MSEYHLAMYFWLSVVGLIVGGPLTIDLIGHVINAVRGKHDDAALPSFPSAPHPS